jgi:hypothetical protein
MPAQDRAAGLDRRTWELVWASFLCWALLMSLAFIREDPRAGARPAAGEAAKVGANQGISFSRDIQPIFNTNCVICHQGVGPAGLGLDPGLSYVNLVAKPSSESKLPRVAPGIPQGSYLVHKLQGTQLSVGGSGGQMPYGGMPLPPPQIALIEGWIQEGAPSN